MGDKLELKVVFAAVDKFLRPVKAITQGASEASKALKANTDRMKEFNRTIEQIDAFKKVERDAAIAANTFKATQDKIAALKVEMSKAGVPSKAMTDDLAKLSKASADLREKHQGLITTEQQLFGKLKAAGIDTRNLAEHRRKLASANAEATNASRQLTAALEAENQKMKRLHAARADFAKSRALAGKIAGIGAGALAVGAGINAAASVPVIAYANAEDAQTQLKIAMMQKGGQVADQFREIDDLANMLGNKLPGTTADFQNMMTMLIRQGMPAKNILGGMGEATAYLGVQLKMGPEGAAEFASKLQDATRTVDKDMMGLMDTIQRMFYIGVDQNNMLEAFKGLGPAMDMIKRQGLDGAKALAPFVVMMDQAGMRGESAGNAIRKVVSRSLNVDNIKDVQGDLKKSKGIDLNLDFTNGKGEFGGIDKLMSELSKLKKFDTVTRLSILKDIYGDDKETNEVLSKIIDKGKAGYEDVIARMESQATLQERVNAQLGTLKSLWDAATGTFTNALVAFGESFSPELHATAEWLGKVAGNVQAWAKENPGLSGTLMTLFKWAGLVALGLGGIAIAAGAVIMPMAAMKLALTTLGISGGPISTALGSIAGHLGSIISPVSIAARIMPILSGAFAGFSAVLAATPIGWVIAGIAALAAAGFVIYQNWEPIKAWFSGFWEGLSAAAGPAVSALWESFKRLLSSIGDLLSLIPGFDSIIVPIFKLASGAVGELFDWLVKLVSPVDDTTDAARRMGKGFGEIAGEIIASMLGLPASMMEAGVNMIDGLMVGIRSRLNSLREMVTGIADSMPVWVKKALDIKSPSRVFAEIGAFTMRGLENGITGGKDGPLGAVSTLAKQLSGIGAGLVIGGSAMAADIPLDTRPSIREIFDNAKRFAGVGTNVVVDDAGKSSNVPLDTRPPIRTSQAAGDSSSNTYQIIIHAAPGTDNAGLAALVSREIERIEASKAIRHRSRLRDME